MIQLNDEEKNFLRKMHEMNIHKEYGELKSLSLEDSGLTGSDFRRVALSLERKGLVKAMAPTEDGLYHLAHLTIDGEDYLPK